MAVVYRLFSKLREGAGTQSDMGQAPKGRTSEKTQHGSEETEQRQLELLDARIKSLEDRLREQGF
jgi:hypothetical protein